MIQLSNFITEPTSRILGVVMVSAVIKYEPTNDVWDVIIVLGRAPGQELIKGDEVNAQLVDRRGKSLTVIERPNGLLTEAGGSMGVSANAQFRFQGSKERPSQLIVMYQSQSVSFNVIFNEANNTRERGKSR